MDARANEIHNDVNEAAAQQSTPRLIPIADEAEKSGLTTLSIAKYLPENIFKNPKLLIHELDAIEIATRSMTRSSRNFILINLAKNIALTTLELNTDYGAKLNLIETALKHRIFQPKNPILRLINRVTDQFKKNRLSRKPRTEAQAILCNALIDIRKNRNAIILC